jgi:O-antigen/teichoic acid export membrane protein
MSAFSERVIVRFAATLLANFLRAGLSFASGIVIARAFGAAGYGNLNFLLGSFAAVMQLLDMGTGAAFFTFISRRRRSIRLFAWYVGWLAAQFLVTSVVVLLMPASLVQRVWLGQDRVVILIAFAASFLTNQVWGFVIQLGEAVRRTIVAQSVAVLQALLHFGLVAVAWYAHRLTVPVVLWLLIAEYLTLAVLVGPMLVRSNLLSQGEVDEPLRETFRAAYRYSRPLAVYGWLGFAYTFADQWMLQRFGGANQQGFFAVGQQFANIGLIATTSMLRVFWKEVAEARERGDGERTRHLYKRTIRSLYFCAAWISCLVLPYAREILNWTVGSSYRGAWLCLSLMFIYPVHQALGQIQGTLFQATGDTTSYARIGLGMMAVSIPITYLLLAPGTAWPVGLDLGAVGLACKLVVLQVVAVNIQGYVVARSNAWPFEYGFQILLLAVLLSIAFLARLVTGGVAPAGAVVYVIVSAAVFLRFPRLIGLNIDPMASFRVLLRQGSKLGPVL